MGSLPEAKIGLVKRMPKREMDSRGLHALVFNYLDLLFRQLIKLVDRGVYLLICGLDLALEGGRLIGVTHKVSTAILAKCQISWV